MVSFLASVSIFGLSCLPAIVSAAPFSFPLANGFPNVTAPSKQLTFIQNKAHGSLPNGGPPANITANTLTSLQLIAFNELSEVAFFTELLSNVTNNVEGYRIQDGATRKFVIDTLKNVQAQEELHALNANNALNHFTKTPIQACQYNFPVSNLEDAIALAATFTDVVLGTLGDVVSLLGQDGDNGLIKGVAAVIGQEGEQDGYYRSLQGKLPSALPFLTSSTREFAFSALNQMFVVPGSCPNSNIIKLPVFAPLSVLTTPDVIINSQTVSFTVTADTTNWPSGNSTPLSLVYINQQNTPVVQKIENIKVDGTTITFDAAFPFNAGTFGNGLTIAAVTKTSGPFTSADAVAQDTLFGPGLIEIN
jgi:hypothetical protein